MTSSELKSERKKYYRLFHSNNPINRITGHGMIVRLPLSDCEVDKIIEEYLETC